MKVEFNQKRGFAKRKHTLYEDKIVVESKTLQQIDKFEIKLDKLGFNIQYQADNTIVRTVVLVISILIPVIVTSLELMLHNIGKVNLLINNFCWLSIAGLALLKQPQDNIFLVGGDKNLVFYRTIPSEKEVLDFIQLVIATTKNNIKTKYLEYDDSVIDEEYMSRLQWLKDSEVITKREFEYYKKEFELKRLL